MNIFTRGFICIIIGFSSFNLKADENLDDQFVHLLHQEPNYFLMGKPNTKVQLSFKAKVFKNVPFYFSYNQRIFWDFFKESKPFRDINYNPGVFYRFTLDEESRKKFDIIFYEHESNGKGGLTSRSWDRSGFRYQSRFNLSNRFQSEWSLKVGIPYNLDDTNRDLRQYRGLYELQLKVSELLGPFFDVNDLIFRVYPGGKSGLNLLKGGREITFRSKLKDVKYLGQIVVQFFEGHGENLLEYNQHVLGFRMGIGF